VISIAAPSAAIAPESQAFFCIDLLSMTHESANRRLNGGRILDP
jgi:urease accessory protein UreF